MKTADKSPHSRGAVPAPALAGDTSFDLPAASQSPAGAAHEYQAAARRLRIIPAPADTACALKLRSAKGPPTAFGTRPFLAAAARACLPLPLAPAGWRESPSRP